MPECARCGVTVYDLPFEELGLSAEDAVETMFEQHEGRTLCQGCYGAEGFDA